MNSNAKLLSLYENKEFEKLLAALKENVREDNAKAAGKSKSNLSIIKNLVKSGEKLNSSNKALQKAHRFDFNGKEYFAFTNGHYLLAGPDSFGYDIAEPHETFRVETMLNIDYCSTKEIELNTEEIKLFAQDHKSGNAAKGTLKPYIIETDSGIIAVNAALLSAALEFCKTNKIIITNFRGVYKYALHIRGIENIGIVLPVNCSEPEEAKEYMNSWRNSMK